MLNHVGFIMDWNRRWAKKRFLPSFAWHKAWADNLINIIKLSKEAWIKNVTFWALSTENIISRSQEELTWIFQLVEKLPDYLADMLNDWVKFEVIWDMDLLPASTSKVLTETIEKTKNNDWITMILAIAYGWRNEIIRWIKKFISSWDDINLLNEKSFLNYIDTWRFPEPDLLVRTWWDIRLSWFLQYVSDYSEFYFSDKYWPDFDKIEFQKAIESFNKAKRNHWK